MFFSHFQNKNDKSHATSFQTRTSLSLGSRGLAYSLHLQQRPIDNIAREQKWGLISSGIWTLHLNTSSGWKHQSIAMNFLSTWNGLRQKWISKVYILFILVMCIRFLRISGICDFVKHINWEMSHWGKWRNNFLHTIKAMWTVAYAGINFIHNHPPTHPERFSPTICSHPGYFTS